MTAEAVAVRSADAHPTTGTWWVGALRRSWLLLWGSLMALVITSVSLGRFTEWDESVFFSQSGGFAGMAAPPAHMAASREIGPAVLIAALRSVAMDLAGVRLLWAVVTVTVLVLAFREVGRTIGTAEALTGAIVFGTSWVVLLYSSSFYGSLLAACCSVAATGVYLRLREPLLDSAAVWRLGIVLGMALAASFWLRQIETAIVLAVLLAHSVLARPAVIWRQRSSAVGAAVATLTLTFAVPWVIDSIIRYGSVGDRLRIARGQSWPTGTVNRAPDYLRALLGESTTYRPLDSVAGLLTAGRLLQVLVLVVAAAALAGAAFRQRTGRRSDDRWLHLLALLTAVAAASFSFFFFYASNTQDRYLMFGWAFACLALGSLVWRGAAAAMRSVPTMGRAALLGILVLWVASQLMILHPYELRRVVDGGDTEAVAQTVGTLASGMPCAGVARYAAPQLQLGSGCVFQSISDAAGAEAALMRFSASEEPRFVVIPRAQAGPLVPPPGWQVVERPRTTGSSVLIFYLPPAIPDPGEG